MIQFFDNIWIALSTPNSNLLNILLFPAGIVENYLFMSLFLIIFNEKASNKQKFAYVILISIISILSLNFLPTLLNVFVNYASIIICIKLIFKLNLLKSFMSLIIPTAVFGLLNILLQNPYMTLLNINFEQFGNTPIYRLSFLFIIYLIVTIICLILKRFKKLKFSLDFINMLDKKTLVVLIVNLIIGFLTLCIQLIINAFYIDIVPISITLLSFLFLVSFFVISVYSFTRVIKLANTTKELENAEEYNKSLEILYDKVKGFKHDFDNIISVIDGYIETNDMKSLKDYFEEVKKDCKITNNLSMINPRIINNPGIYSLLNNKYFKATNSEVVFDIDFFLDFSTLKINTYEFSRMLGILLDNAIEEAEKCEEKLVRITFKRENKNHRAVITIENTYSNKNVDIDKIFKKGVSGKPDHTGIGLWEVRNYVSKTKNLDLYTSKNNKFFKQELSIYDYRVEDNT